MNHIQRSQCCMRWVSRLASLSSASPPFWSTYSAKATTVCERSTRAQRAVWSYCSKLTAKSYMAGWPKGFSAQAGKPCCLTMLCRDISEYVRENERRINWFGCCSCPLADTIIFRTSDPSYAEVEVTEAETAASNDMLIDVCCRLHRAKWQSEL